MQRARSAVRQDEGSNGQCPACGALRYAGPRRDESREVQAVMHQWLSGQVPAEQNNWVARVSKWVFDSGLLFMRMVCMECYVVVDLSVFQAMVC